MLTRTPEQIALSETNRLCREIVHLAADAAEQAHDSGVKLVMTELARTHRKLVTALDECIRATGDLPRGSDPDLETVKELATRAKKVFASDGDAVLLDERITAEQELLAYIAESLALELGSELRACLEEAQRTAREALVKLHNERELRNPP
jgi:hypothetical protein